MIERTQTTASLVLAILALATFVLTSSQSQAEPIAATGWNVDFVYGTGETYAGHEKPENPVIWFADDTGIGPGPGIPASGALSVSGHDFQLEPFTAGTDNVLRSNAATNTLTLTTPAKYSELVLLGSNTGGNQIADWEIVLNFTDAASTGAITYFPFGNWAGSGAEFNPTLWRDNATSEFGGQLNTRVLDLATLGHSEKTLQSIDFSNANGANTNLALFGLSGTPTGPDLIAPTLSGSDIVDDQGGGSVAANLPVIYTVTFSEDMDDSTVAAADFGNAGTSGITFGTISETGPGVFTVEVTPTSAGTLELQVIMGAALSDAAGNPLDTSVAIVDDTSLTVEAFDLTNPTLAGSGIVDDQSGGPVDQNSLVTYTVSFSENMDAGTVDATDFGNAGTAAITIGMITESSPGVFSIEVTPTDPGTLQLEVVAGAGLTDPSGNPLDTSAAITDDTTITVEAVMAYVYGENPESQPQATTWQNGSISDLVDFGGEFLRKLTDGQLATGGWKDFTHVGFRNDTDNGAPQPRVTFDLGGLFQMSTIDVFSNVDFAALDSVDVSTSTDGVTFGPAVSFPLSFSVVPGPNANLTQATLDVSALPAATHCRLDFFQDQQWAMINEVEFTLSGPAGSFAITQIVYSPSDNQVTLTWDSSPGEKFAVKYSTDLNDWGGDLNDNVAADAAGDSTTETFDLEPAGLAGQARAYFRVERIPAG